MTVRCAAILAVLGAALAGTAAFAQNFEIVADFGAPEGMEPYGGLIEASDGYFYGTTAGGGFGYGTIYRVDLTGTIETLYLFDRVGGSRPEGLLTQASDGLLYGTTRLGGVSMKGTIFKFNPSNGAFTLLRSFSGADGAEPTAGVVEAADGYLYGTTSSGGLSGCSGTTCGTVFRVSRAGAFNTVVRFNKTNGANPTGGLAPAPDGRLFGTTSKGGTLDRGTVFSLNLSGVLTTLHSFNLTNGFMPYGTLVRAADGKFYGTTTGGGAFYKGTVFTMTVAGAFAIVHSFTGVEGSYPAAALVQGSDGALYGTAKMGGATGQGTVFKLTTAGVTRLHSFALASGVNPASPLVQTTAGQFYGLTSASGPPGAAGTLFKISSGGGLDVAHAFKGSPVKPYSTLVEGSDGLLRGTTYSGGGFNKGTIYALDPAGRVDMLYAFSGPDGGNPVGHLMQSSTGQWYGATTTGGANSLGTVMKLNASGIPTTLASLNPTNGFPSYGGVVEASNGFFYGTTYNGGSGYGTIFQVTPAGVFSIVHNFGSADGRSPYAGMVTGPGGLLFGTTTAGGASGLGVIYSFDPLARVYRRLASFNGTNGASPRAQLTRAADGYLYGTTMNGGAHGFGTIFRFDPGADTITSLHSFTGAGGGEAYAALTDGTGSRFYGTTYVGGSSNRGTVFQFDVATRQFTTLHSFHGDDGEYPHAGLLLASNGKLYGTTTTGGSADNGVVFRVDPSSGTGFVTLVSPDTAVNWGVGSKQKIKWKHNLGKEALMKIEVSRDAGATWQVITATAKNSDATSGVYSWTVAGPATSQARVRVSAAGEPDVAAVSPVNFTIAASFITVTKPLAGTIWRYGSTHTLSWNTNLGADKVSVALSVDGGTTFPIVLVASVPASEPVTFKVPVLGVPTTAARIRVKWLDGSVQGTSPNNFAIKP